MVERVHLTVGAHFNQISLPDEPFHLGVVNFDKKRSTGVVLDKAEDATAADTTAGVIRWNAHGEHRQSRREGLVV